MRLIFYWLVITSLFGLVCCSLGNSFPSYRLCVETCREDNCDQDGYYYKEPKRIPILMRLFWRCNSDCQYHCMWETVATFEQKGWQAPQFHGKWPFIRWFGLQEPASAIFSLLNLAIHIKMYRKYTQEVRYSYPMYFIWTLYAVVCMNAWVWSAVFHSRDLPFTETMDYLSAFGMVFYFLYGVGIRLLLRARKAYMIMFTVICAAFFINHALYLTWDTFDYNYNMLANITAGALSGTMSIFWCAYNWHRLPHSRLLAIVIFLCAATTVLELSDFPPLLWTFDAHALWHLSTVPIPYFFWRFVIEDCKYLRKNLYKWFEERPVI